MDQPSVLSTPPQRSCVPGSRWLRLVQPSYSDFLFIALTAWLFLTSAEGYRALLADGDTGWHIRTGDYILATGQVPRTDLFSFSKPGQAWFAWEWGSDVLYSLIHKQWGLRGIVWFGGLQIVLFATILFRYAMWRRANALWTVAVGMLAVGASSVHYLARPHLFTLLFMPVCIWLVEADRRNPGPRVWWTVAITLAWTNLHGGFLGWIACLGLYFLGTAFETALRAPGERNWRPVWRLALLGAASAAVTFVNPYGWQLHGHIASYLQSDFIRDTIQEFQAPTFRSEDQLQYEILLLLGLMTAAALAARKRFAETLLILFWAHQSLNSIRHITIFSTIAAPLIAEEITRLWEWWVASGSRKSTRAIIDAMATDMRSNFSWTSLWPAVAASVLLLVGGLPVKWPTDFPDEKFPTKLIGKHERLIRSGRVLTTDQWADYLIYRFYPNQRVFVDGRSDFYGPVLGKEYLRASGGAHDWRQILDRHRFDRALVPLSWSLSSLLKQDATWRVVADDGKAVLFERVKGAEEASLAPPGNFPNSALMN